MKKLFAISTLFLLFSCEITQEVHFNNDKSGKYSMSVDMSEIASMQQKNTEVIDTTIVVADFIEKNKDTIAKLSNKEQEAIKLLEGFSFKVKNDSITTKFGFDYNFKDLQELNSMYKKIKSIEDFDKLYSKKKQTNYNNDALENLSKLFTYKFKGNNFYINAMPEYFKKLSNNLSIPNLSQMMKFKFIYTFDREVKKIDNKNVKILYNQKGIEIDVNLEDMMNNPEMFNTKIKLK